MKFEGTPGEWIADIRGGCAAIYPKDRANDTPGCHRDDERNIAYSSKGANYDELAGHWNLDPSVKHDFRLMAMAPKLLDSLRRIVKEAENPKGDLYSLLSEIQYAKPVITKAIGKEE